MLTPGAMKFESTNNTLNACILFIPQTVDKCRFAFQKNLGPEWSLQSWGVGLNSSKNIAIFKIFLD